MIEEFLKYMKYLYTTTGDLSIIQEKLFNYISFLEEPLKQLCVFVADDYLIKKNTLFIDYLLERKIYRSVCGGETFFLNFNKYMNAKNIQMVYVYLIALQLGFRGKYDEFPKNVYNNAILLLNFSENKNMCTYKPSNVHYYKYSWLLLILPIIIVYLYINALEFLLIKKIGIYITHVGQLVRVI